MSALSPASAKEDLSALCDAAGVQAAASTGVPAQVLHAIALTETGRIVDGRQRSWPWTVNMEGAGKWFDSPGDALEFVREHHARGARSYDVGCFQINYRWHGNAFASIEQMFDPLANALYAARFLRRLHGETGSWSEAAGAYHSRTPKYASRYKARFDRILARLTGGQPLPAPADMEEPPDDAPIEVAGPLSIHPPSIPRLGSLMPIDTLPRAGALLAAPRGPLF